MISVATFTAVASTVNIQFVSSMHPFELASRALERCNWCANALYIWIPEETNLLITLLQANAKTTAFTILSIAVDKSVTGLHRCQRQLFDGLRFSGTKAQASAA